MDKELERAFIAGFVAGFKATGEGFNAECPFEYDSKIMANDEQFREHLIESAKEYFNID